MLNKQLHKKVYFEKTIKVFSDIAKGAFIERTKNPAITSIIAYTKPELIPGGYGVMGIAVIIDNSSMINEISPEIIICSNSSEYNNIILNATNITNGVSRDNVALDMSSSGVIEQVVTYYNNYTKQSLTSIVNIDIKSVMAILAEIISEDLTHVRDYVNAINGDMNLLAFQGACVRVSDTEEIIKQNNTFTFPDGLIVILNRVMRRPDGTFDWDYSVGLGNELMRAAKDDGAFNTLNNQYNYNGGGYGYNGGGYMR